MKRNDRERQCGFTLVEVLLSLVVTVVAVVMIAQGFTLGGSASVSSQKLTRAVWLAQMKMVELETGETAVNMGDEGDFSPDHPEFKYSIESDFSEEISMYEVRITVSWEERSEEQTFTLTRLLYRPGPGD
ncbi:MAG: prepilin-type N-terminal cleavage/methylation domain-containing protein [Planctomycetota bacterium]|jgi:hypothetical protein